MILAACLIPAAALAQGPVSEALPFTQLDYNPASIGMGGTVVPSAAVLPLKEVKLAGGLSYQNYMPGISATQYIGGGVAGCLDKLGYSFSFVHGSGEKIYIMDGAVDNYTPTEMLVNAGVSYAILDQLAVGVNVKYAQEQPLLNYSNSAIAADVFVAGKFSGLDFAAGVSSVGQKVKSQDTGEYSLPSAIVASAGYAYELTEDNVVSARARVDSFFSGALAAGAGVEYCWSGMVCARAGYHYGGDSIIPTYASAGLGLRYSGFTLDAAYLFASDVLGGSFAISAGVRF